MTRRGFALELARSGADLAAWPVPAREAALALLERSDAARTVFARALAAEAPPSLSAADISADVALGGRLFVPLRGALPSVLAGERPASRARRRPILGWGAVAAAVALGLWLGGGGVDVAPHPSPDLFASAQLAPLGAYQP